MSTHRRHRGATAAFAIAALGFTVAACGMPEPSVPAAPPDVTPSGIRIRALDLAIPRDCGEVPAVACEAAVAAAYAQPQGNGTPATLHVTSVRVRPSRYVGGCQPFDPPVFDVTFEVREAPGTIEITLGARPDGRLYYCTY